eukprot:8143096-Alexandrium_andersonii.AAC.1
MEVHLVACLRQGGHCQQRALHCSHLELDAAPVALLRDEPQLRLAEVGDPATVGGKVARALLRGLSGGNLVTAQQPSGMAEAAAPESIASCTFT